MKPILTQIFAGLFLLLASQALGQVTTSFVVTAPAAPSPYPIGTHIEIELRVTGFTNISSMQFPITYNKDVMKFDSLSNAAFSNWNAGNFVSNPAAGKIGVSWDGFSAGANMPFTFPAGTVLFKLHFVVIGNGVSTVNINPALAPPGLELVGAGGPVMVNYQSGGTPTLTLGTGNPPPPPLVGFKIVANTIYIPQGERGCMPLTVNDFDNIVSMQWAMHWDNAVLNYECTRAFNLPGWSATDFNSIYAPGLLLGGWADPAGIGVTRADGVRIVDVCFKAVGAPGGTATVTIDGVGFPPGNGSAEAYNTSSVNVWATGGLNGASGVSAPVNIIVTSPPPFDVTYNVDTVSAAPNTQGCVAVKVRNFTAVTTSEFALAYNPAQLTYVNTTFGANPLNLQASNISHVVNPGVIKFLWANANGVTVANDAAIFSACFTVIAPAGTTSDITFTSTACPSITGIGTAKAGGGVSMARINGWLKSKTQGPPSNVTNVKCNGGNTGAITLDVTSGPSPSSYAWAGPNGFTSATKDVTGLVAGTYTVTVTYSGGNTVVVNPPAITQPPALAQINSVNTVSCFGGNNGAINLSPAGGTTPYTYMWSNGATVQDPANLTVDIYTLTLKDVNNCTLGPINITVSGFTSITLPTPTVTNVTCAGLSTGSIVIGPTGGAGNYTYDWSHNGPQTPDTDTKDLMGMPAGTYTVTITDLNGCTMSLPTSGQGITIAAAPALSSSLDNKADVKCFGTPTGAANITVAGGTGTKTFCWTTTGGNPCASTMEDPTNLPAGTYTVVVTDQNGCTNTLSNVAIAPPSNGAVTVSATTQPSPCFEQAAGSINASATGGWGNYTYAWTGPISPIPAICCPSGLPGGTYSVTVTDNGGCTTTQSFTVGGSPAISTNTLMVQPVTCFGSSNGGIDLNLTGGNPNYQVAWSNTPLTGEAIGNLAPGVYQPTVTDAQGCTKVFAEITVTGPGELMVGSTIAVANPSDGAIDLEIMSGGTPTFTYLWSTGATTQDISGLAVGAYTVVIKDANACERTLTYTVQSGNVVGGVLVSSIKNACSGDGCIFLNIPQTAAGFAPFTINWGFGTMQSTSLTPSICDLNAGLYNITVTASNGNSSVLSAVQVGQLDPASVNSNTTNPFSSVVKNGKITLDKASGVVCNLLYQWGPLPLNSTSNEVTNLGQGTYTVTITNPCSGCVSVREFTLEYSPINIGLNGAGAIVNPNCSNSPTGSINITVQGGNPPYVYAWTGPNGFVASTEDINMLNPGVYNVTATDQDSRITSDTYTLTAQSNLDITNVNETSLYGSFQVSGDGMCDGVAAVVFTAGLGNTAILWSNGVTTASNTTLCGGAYSVTLTDAAGCSSVWSDALTAPAAITADGISDGVKCFGDCNGIAKVAVSGGVGPYSVRWSTGQFDPLVNASGFSQAVNLCGGDYTVTITDDNDVDKVFVVNVPQPAQIEVIFSPTAPRNFNSCDGDILANITGAVEPITYVWSGSFGHSGEEARAEELCSGEFIQFYITDANGCRAYAFDSVPYPADGCFRVSPVITPGQQDGKNDFVIITCIETASKNRMEIYNRWGQLVFETDNYSNDDTNLEQNWNGLTNSGNALAEGVYYYVLTYSYFDDQGKKHDETRKGAINLLR